mmetsp:Transcript_62035/g.202383  ORF Transcript_62035/g.202383 Transcript_62035/m.202383 type:complete len:218 (-) Transcript_62035:359-1012(-)
MHVHAALQGMRIDVVDVASKGPLELGCDLVQGPQGEYLNKSEYTGSHDGVAPVDHDPWCQDPMTGEQQNGGLRIREWERDFGVLVRIMEFGHPCRELLEGAVHDGWRKAQHALVHAVDHKLLDPPVHQLHAATTPVQGVNTRVVNPCRIQSLQPPRVVLADIGELLLIAGSRATAECCQAAGRIEPPRQHLVGVVEGVPKAGVGLGRPKHYEEDHQE